MDNGILTLWYTFLPIATALGKPLEILFPQEIEGSGMQVRMGMIGSI